MTRKLSRTFASLCLSVCLLCLAPLRASAWSRDGHQIVAEIALWRLKKLKADQTLKSIFALLKSKPETFMLKKPGTLRAAATWPDEVRGSQEYAFASDLHFVNIVLNKKVDKDKFDRLSQCRKSDRIPEGVCIIGALEHYMKVLSSSDSTKARLEALGFITHFMGDLHQPLHTAEDSSFVFNNKPGDRGGNFIFIFYLKAAAFNSNDINSCLQDPDACTERFDDERSNRKLHAAWDKYMIRTEMNENSDRETMQAYADDLIGKLPGNPLAPAFASIEAGDFVSWAEESHDLAEKNAYALIGPQDKISPQDNQKTSFFLLNDAYRKKNMRLIDQQLTRAGIRLALILRRIFPND
jgi:hypothetical protein